MLVGGSTEILAVYRIRPQGVLKRLRRWPASVVVWAPRRAPVNRWADLYHQATVPNNLVRGWPALAGTTHQCIRLFTTVVCRVTHRAARKHNIGSLAITSFTGIGRARSGADECV